MARPNKLKRFAEMQAFPHVFEPDGTAIMTEDYSMKGHWGSRFFKNHAPITLELGCGKGEYSVGLASRYPNSNFIGIDIKGARMWKGATAALQHDLRNVAFIRTKIEFIERIFAPSEVDEIWITFPDPQPKKASKRLTSSYFLQRYLSILKPGGLIHLKTDSQLLHEYLKVLLHENGIEAEICCGDVYQSYPEDQLLSLKTYYEEGFIAQGKPITYIRFQMPRAISWKEPLKFDYTKWI